MVHRPEAASTSLPGWLGRVLEVPLRWKLVGANAAILIAAGTALWVGRDQPVSRSAPVIVGALVLSFAVNLLLVHVALRPLAALEETARRVSRGDLAARVARSAVADRDMARIGQTINLLLDSLTADRSRMRQLAAKVIRAQDEERARLARELHDSTAQVLAAAMLQLSAATTRGRDDPELARSLDTLRQLVAAALEEVRTMSHAIHPRVLDDLGLVEALEWLARQTAETAGLEVDVEAAFDAEIAPTSASALYRVAQEALRNAVTHSGASRIRIWITGDRSSATLEVVDDGSGFDVDAAEARRPGMGLFSIRERVSLVGGTVEIHSIHGRGTRVTATVPLAPPEPV
ncbi:MAG: sensor histidine kinase [Gemmatimonadaceae bacterium]